MKLFEMLSEVDNICKKYSIQYYLAAGGLLGAVRNGGFLPWDDDIDLYITRNNWKKFVQVINNEIPNNRNFICEGMSPYYHNPIGRYVDKESTFQLRGLLLPGNCGGLFIEFFILDPLPVNQEKRVKHIEALKLYTELANPYFSYNESLLDGDGYYNPSAFSEYHERMKNEGWDVISKELLCFIESTSDSECEEYCMRYGKNIYIFPKESFGAGREISFCGKKFPVAQQVERILRIGYGDDWMNVPVIQNRAYHSATINLTVPYKQFVDVYMPLIDKDEYLDACYQVKDNVNNNIYNLTRLINKNAEITLAIARNVFNKSSNSIENLKELLELGKYKELAECFSILESTHNNFAVSEINGVIELENEYIELYLRYLIETDRFYDAKKILNRIKRNNNKISNNLIELNDICEVCKRLSIAIYEQKNESLVSDILESIKFDDRIPNYQEAILWIEKKKANETRQYDVLLKKSVGAVNKCKQSGIVRSYLAYALHMIGEMDASYNEYKNACASTNNAFVWKEALELAGINMYEKHDIVYNEFEEELIGLYKEIEELSRYNGFQCIVVGQFLKRLLGTGQGSFFEINVAMPLIQIESIAQFVNNTIPDRTIDFDEESCSFRYCNTKSTLINNENITGNKSHTISVRIIPIEKINGKFLQKNASLVKKLMKTMGTVNVNNLKDRVVLAIGKICISIFGKTRTKKLLYRQYKRITGLRHIQSKSNLKYRIGNATINSNSIIEIKEGVCTNIHFNYIDELIYNRIIKEKTKITKSDLFFADNRYAYDDIIDDRINEMINEYCLYSAEYSIVKKEALSSYKRKAKPWKIFNMSAEIVELRHMLKKIDITDIENKDTQEAIAKYRNQEKKWVEQCMSFPRIDEYEKALLSFPQQ